ncbi:MAG: hypothetical protein ACOY4T_08255 [Pseudomonadota bacterium]
MIAEELVDRLSGEVGHRLLAKARRQRVRALGTLRECRVTVTRDGEGTWEERFERPPTLAELVSRVGPSAYVVAICMKSRSLRERLRFGIAAE